MPIDLTPNSDFRYSLSGEFFGEMFAERLIDELNNPAAHNKAQEGA